jgi:hypothetical protein
MYKSKDVSIWNLTPGAHAVAGAQLLFNIVGRLHNPEEVASLHYSLNGAPERLVHFRQGHCKGGRLIGIGDFNIDTCTFEDLQQQNILELRILNRDQKQRLHTIPFTIRGSDAAQPTFQMDLEDAESPEQVGQIIDGHWRIGRDEKGVRVLEIREEDAGYDRLITFGRHDWTAGYEVVAKLCVTAWTNLKYQNVGLLFKWNPHDQGDGLRLPRKWSTGLAYYAAQCPGLRLRFGVGVHIDDAGRKVGCYVLDEKPFSIWRRWIGFFKNEALQIGRQPFTQLRTGVQYNFRLRVHPRRYTLTVWPASQPEPEPQLDVLDPPDLLPSGSVGIIAAYCAVRVYSLGVAPLVTSGAIRSTSRA